MQQKTKDAIKRAKEAIKLSKPCAKCGHEPTWEEIGQAMNPPVTGARAQQIVKAHKRRMAK